MVEVTTNIPVDEGRLAALTKAFDKVPPEQKEQIGRDRRVSSVVVGGEGEFEPRRASEQPQEEQDATPGHQETPEKEASPEAPERPEKPEGGFDKFWNPKTGEYNWQAHAKELEFKLTKAKEKKKPAKEEAETEATEADVDAEAKELVEEAGLDWKELEAQVINNGTLDEDAFSALENIGVPRDIVEAHLAGLKALQERTQAQVYAKTGGPERLQALLEWASSNLTPDEIVSYNNMLAGQNWNVALDALMARAGSSARPQYRPDEPAATASYGEVYASHEEQMKDQQDPRYRSSPDFRAKVIKKIENTLRSRGRNPIYQYM